MATCPPPCPYSTQTPVLCSAVRPVVHDNRAYEGNHFCTSCRRSFQAECDYVYVPVRRRREIADHAFEGDGSDDPTICSCGEPISLHLRRPV